jgi:PPOX class probable FMN-dependent enzyme
MTSEEELRGGRVTSEAELARLYGTVSHRAAEKVHVRLDEHDADFIGRSPFLALASSSAAGHLDVSPRGDLPGFVKVLKSGDLVLPDRPGNNRLDTMRNVLGDPRVGLLFFVPGVEFTLRVNGIAEIRTDRELCELGLLRGRCPISVLLITPAEVFFQCPRALRRNRLWSAVSPVPLDLDEILADQVPDLTVEESRDAGRRAANAPLW